MKTGSGRRKTFADILGDALRGDIFLDTGENHLYYDKLTEAVVEPHESTVNHEKSIRQRTLWYGPEIPRTRRRPPVAGIRRLGSGDYGKRTQFAPFEAGT